MRPVLIVIALTSTVAAAPKSPACTTVPVVDQYGHPVRHALVIRWDSDPDGATGTGGVGQWESDATGALCVPTGEWSGYFTIEPDGEHGGSCAGHVKLLGAGTPPARIVMPVKPLAMAKVTGKVVTTDGSPAAGVTVDVLDLAVGTCGGARPTLRIPTTGDGRFTIETVRGDLEGRVFGDAIEETAFHFAAGSKDNVVIAHDGAQWRGRVLAPDGTPLTPAYVAACDPDNDCKGATAVGDEYVIAHLRPGAHTLVALVEHDAVLGWRRIDTPLVFAQDEHRAADLQFAPGRDISGTTRPNVVIDATKKGAAVQSGRKTAIQIQSDANGHFVFHQMEPGTWALSAFMPDRPGIAHPVEAAAGDTNVKLP